jgi:serine/threonine protein kinase
MSERHGEPANQVTEAMDRFNKEWDGAQKGGGDPPEIADFVERVPAKDRTRLLVELIKFDLEWRPENGCRINSYLERWPELRESREAIVELVTEEFELRVEGGELAARVADDLRDRFREFRLQPGELAPHLTNLELRPGLRVSGFELLRPLPGAGPALGATWLARTAVPGQYASIRYPLPYTQLSNEEIELLRHQGDRLMRLNDARIARLYELGYTERCLYLAQEYIDGRSLEREIADGPLPVRRAVRIVARTAHVLHYAHTTRDHILHGDLQPSKIILGEADRVTVLDFGLTGLWEHRREEIALSYPGILANPSYQSPEQLEEPTTVDARSDVYSLGVILYELLSGRRPFHCRGREYHDACQQIAERVRREQYTPLRAWRREVPRELEAICRRAMAREQRDRYPNARTLALDLRRFLRRQPVSAQTYATPVTRRIQLGFQRKPVGASLTAALLVTLLGSMAVLSFKVWSNTNSPANSSAARSSPAIPAAAPAGQWKTSIASGVPVSDPSTPEPSTTDAAPEQSDINPAAPAAAQTAQDGTGLLPDPRQSGYGSIIRPVARETKQSEGVLQLGPGVWAALSPDASVADWIQQHEPVTILDLRRQVAPDDVRPLERAANRRSLGLMTPENLEQYLPVLSWFSDAHKQPVLIWDDAPDRPAALWYLHQRRTGVGAEEAATHRSRLGAQDSAWWAAAERVVLENEVSSKGEQTKPPNND